MILNLFALLVLATFVLWVLGLGYNVQGISIACLLTVFVMCPVLMFASYDLTGGGLSVRDPTMPYYFVALMLITILAIIGKTTGFWKGTKYRDEVM